MFSEPAYEREKKTLEKKLKQKEEELRQILLHFEKQKFHCERDAWKAFEEMKEGYKLHEIKAQMQPVYKYTNRGRPKKGA